ncbi:MAG TPA: FG-GAP repeat protein [Polyangia bacterium]|nr:FG-GAP repeat protein [Polyangia bacterium]
MRGPAKYLLALAAAGVLAAGCDWRDFDNLQNQVPVARIDPPSGYQASSDFGGTLLPVAPPADGSAAAWFLASGTEALGLALVKVDAAGNVSGATLSGPAVDTLGSDPVPAMAEIPGTGTALLGCPTFASLLTVDLASATVSAFTPSTPLETLFGIGVAAGNLAGAATPDLAVTSQTSLHVYLDGATTDLTPAASELASCPIALSSNFTGGALARRPMVIGNLLGSGPVVAVGTPGAGAAGSVSFFSATSSAVTCAGVLTAPALTPATTVNAGFGTALAIGDFDGDGAADLLVGAPPGAVYLYKGPIASGAAPTATIKPAAGGVAFGAALAAANLDGVAGDEALIGDPQATVGGQTGAGSVTVYTGPKLASTPASNGVLTDHDSNAGESYGAAVAALPFCATAGCTSPTVLPLVGAPAHAFVYFTVGSTDPRTK